VEVEAVADGRCTAPVLEKDKQSFSLQPLPIMVEAVSCLYVVELMGYDHMNADALRYTTSSRVFQGCLSVAIAS